MKDSDISTLIATQARSILEDNRILLAMLVSKGQRFENWLQLEIFKSLLCTHPLLEIERAFPGGKERCDFWMEENEGKESWLELKLCVTNYCTKFRVNQSPRPITNQIDGVIQDAEKLRQVPAHHSRKMLLIAYPLPNTEEESPHWSGHLRKVKAKVNSVCRAFSLSIERNSETARISGYVLTV